METAAPLVQAITRMSAIFPVLSWEHCAQRVIEKQRPSTVTFVCKSEDECPSNAFYRMIRTPLQTIFGLETHKLPTFRHHDLVFILTHDEFVHWNNQTVQKYRMQGKNSFKIVIVANTNGSFKDNTAFLRNLFQPMWQSGVINAAVVLMNETDAQVFTYFPYRSNDPCEDASPVLLGKCEDVADVILDGSKKVQNLNKCPIRITLVDDRPFINYPSTGRLFDLIDEIAVRMNFTVQSMLPVSGDSGASCGPEEFTGSRGDVANGTAHMAVGSFNRKECSTLEYVSLSYTQCLSWGTPVISEPDYIFVFLVQRFQPQVWAAVIVTVLCVVTTVSILRVVANDQGSTTNVVSLACMLFAPMPLDFRSTPVRLVLALWLCTCLVIRTAYESELQSKSAVSLGTFVIRTLEDLLSTELNLCTSLANQQMLKSAEEPEISIFYNITKICDPSLYAQLVSAAKEQNSAVFTSDLRCRVIASQFSSEEPPLYFRTGGCFKMYQLTPIITLPGSPFKKQWQVIQQRCMESGLIKKWIDFEPSKRRRRRARVFTLEHLFPVLFILGLGCLLGFVVFLAENVFYRVCHRLKLY